jgi:hypothetical protein
LRGNGRIAPTMMHFSGKFIEPWNLEELAGNISERSWVF